MSLLRNLSAYDLIRYHKFALKHPNIKPIELIKMYDKKYPELTSKQKLINLAKALKLRELYKALIKNDN